jgi:hypothetical protein
MMAEAYELRTAKVCWKTIARQLDVNVETLISAMRRAGIPMEGHRTIRVTVPILERVHALKQSGKICWWRIEQDTGIKRDTIRSAYRRWIASDFKTPGVKSEYL